MLKFGAIHLNYHAGIPEENFGSRFDNARFARSGRSQEQQVANWPSLRVQSSAKDLMKIYECLNSFFLPDDLGPHGTVEVMCDLAADCRVQLLSGGGSHFLPPRVGPRERDADLWQCMGSAIPLTTKWTENRAKWLFGDIPPAESWIGVDICQAVDRGRTENPMLAARDSESSADLCSGTKTEMENRSSK